MIQLLRAIFKLSQMALHMNHNKIFLTYYSESFGKNNLAQHSIFCRSASNLFYVPPARKFAFTLQLREA